LKINFKHAIISAASAVVLVLGISACAGNNVDASASAPDPTSSDNVAGGSVLGGSESNTAQLFYNLGVKTFDSGIFSQMNGPSMEMVNDGRRDLTLNNPNHIGYVYVYSQTGTLITFYTIKGKVSSTQSQLTETQDIVDDKNCVSGDDSGQGGGTIGACSNVVDSIGDDGTYGGEEGGPSGVFFFTTAGALVELGGNTNWFYSDAPLALTSKPVMIYNNNAPTSGAVTLPKGNK